MAPITETNEHSLEAILRESLDHEVEAVKLSRDLSTVVEGTSIFLEEPARGQVAREEEHQLELREMLRDDV